MPPDSPHPDNADSGGEGQHSNDPPLQGRVQHQQVSARVPESVGTGEFSNGAVILRGAHETVIDFSLRLGEQQRICSRVILTHAVTSDFARALEENLAHYASHFGGPPSLPTVTPPPPSTPPAPHEPAAASAGNAAPESDTSPGIEQIYDDLKIGESVMVGQYANAVLIRHSGTEFCFDFIANVYPRSVVTSRIFMPAPHVPRLLESLRHASREHPHGPGPA